ALQVAPGAAAGPVRWTAPRRHPRQCHRIRVEISDGDDDHDADWNARRTSQLPATPSGAGAPPGRGRPDAPRTATVPRGLRPAGRISTVPQVRRAVRPAPGRAHAWPP